MKIELEDMIESYTVNKNGIFVKVLEWQKEVIEVLSDVFEVDPSELKSIEFYFKETKTLTEAREKFKKIKTLHPDYTWTVLIRKGKIIETYSYM